MRLARICLSFEVEHVSIQKGQQTLIVYISR